MKTIILSMFILSSHLALGKNLQVISADSFPSTFLGHIEQLENGELLYRDGRLLRNFSRMGKINPKYFSGNEKVEVEICNYHFPEGSEARKEIEMALSEYVQLEGVDIHWKIKSVPHRNADKIISPNIADGSLRIDFADADKYPNACKRKGQQGTWVLTRCGYSHWGGWKGSDLFGNLDAGAILINRHKYCPKDEQDCLRKFPKKQAYLHELGHYMGMTHSGSWPKEHKTFTSVMGAHQNYLTAYDAKNLRSNYGKNENKKTLESENEDFVVIGRMKWSKGGENFDQANPQDLYFVSAQQPLYDCKTKSPAKFQVGLYNRAASDIGSQYEVEVTIGVEINNTMYEMGKMKINQIPAYSELIWKGEFEAASVPVNIESSTKARYFLKLTPEKMAEAGAENIINNNKKSKHLQLMNIQVHPSANSCNKKLDVIEERSDVDEECFED